MKIVKTIIIIAIIMILAGIILEIGEMIIDHNCYQLEPNEFYQSSICERYWRD